MDASAAWLGYQSHRKQARQLERAPLANPGKVAETFGGISID